MASTMKQLFRLLFALLFLLVMSIERPPAFAASQDDVWPTDGWQKALPEEVGVNSAALVAFLETNPDVHTLMAVRHGKVFLDISRYPYTSTEPHSLFSVTKGVVSMAMGVAIDKGYIKRVDQSIWDFFPADETSKMDDRKRAITIEHLLTHTTGLGVTDDLAIFRLTTNDPAWVQFTLDSRMNYEPGTYFQYLDSVAHLTSALIQKATGMSTADFAAQYIFDPLNITDAVWASDPQGVSVGGMQLYLSPASMAKLGYLYLHEGEWNGQQIVSADWVAKSTDGTVPEQFWDYYGYYWANGTVSGTDAQGFVVLGYRGQAIWVVPELDLVFITTGGANVINDWPTKIVQAASTEETLPPDSVSNDKLQSIVDLWANPPAGNLRPISPALKELSGLKYQLEDNDLGWMSFSIDFAKPEEAVITIELADRTLTLPVGLDNNFRVSEDGLPPEPLWRPVDHVPLLMKGGTLGNKLILTMDDLMSMDTWTLTIDVSADGSQIWIAAQSFNDGETMTPQPQTLTGSRASV